ncbi:hypothetical protein BKA70DRAFT_1225888 [Coprinopsis sp. MPI-PUGE-AT-0042]|nr:hypothetical protein BKA70DRAFT_1225888 [Coprinopsis sp. MPI-PUGE-AT-0042]
MSYNERLLVPRMDGPPYLRVLRALNHPLQPVPGSSVYVVNSFDKPIDTHRALASRFCLKKGDADAGRFLLCLKPGDRVVWRAEGTKVEDDRLLLTTDFDGYPNREVAMEAKALPSPLFKLEDIGLDVTLDLYQDCDYPGKAAGTDAGNNEYTVDRILDERSVRVANTTSTEFLVRWKGWPPSTDSWIPLEDADDLEAMDRWEARLTPTGPSLSDSVNVD